MQQATLQIGETMIWERIMDADSNGLSPEGARSLLGLRFSQNDKERMNELAQRNQEGLLSDAERRELEAYVNVGDVLALIHLKAQESLDQSA